MKKFLDKSKNEAEFEEILFDLIRKAKELFGDEYVISKHNKILINKGVYTEEECRQPKWKEFLMSATFRRILKTNCDNYDSRNDS